MNSAWHFVSFLYVVWNYHCYCSSGMKKVCLFSCRSNDLNMKVHHPNIRPQYHQTPSSLAWHSQISGSSYIDGQAQRRSFCWRVMDELGVFPLLILFMNFFPSSLNTLCRVRVTKLQAFPCLLVSTRDFTNFTSFNASFLRIDVSPILDEKNAWNISRISSCLQH